MIFDDILNSSNKEIINTKSNKFLDIIIDSKKLNWFKRWKLRRELKKNLNDDFTPDIKNLALIANSIQMLGMYLLYPNNQEDSVLSSYRKQGTEYIILKITDNIIVKIKVKNTNASMEICGLSTDTIAIQWSKASIEGVITNRYDEELFGRVTRKLVNEFRNVILRYL